MKIERTGTYTHDGYDEWTCGDACLSRSFPFANAWSTERDTETPVYEIDGIEIVASCLADAKKQLRDAAAACLVRPRPQGYAPRPHMRRTRILTVRLHEQEMDELERDAEAAGTSKARLMREAYGFEPIVERIHDGDQGVDTDEGGG